MKGEILGLIAAGLLAGPVAASATTITDSWNFSINADNGQTYTGQFSFAGLETSATYTNSTAASFAFSSVNLPTVGNGGIGFSFSGGSLILGGLDLGVGSGTLGDWGLLITSFPSDPTLSVFLFSTDDGLIEEHSGTITMADVPEPAAHALLGLGFACAGFGAARRRRPRWALRGPAGRRRRP